MMVSNFNIGKNIRKIRKEKGYTLDDFSKKTKIPKATLCRYETYHNEPTYSKLLIIADALGCSVIEIMNGSLKENKHLNYEQLKKMTGKPIYHKNLGMWFICQGVFTNLYNQQFVTVNHDGCSTLFYEDDCYYTKEVKDDGN